MENEDTAANPAEEGGATLADIMEANPPEQPEATALAEGGDDSIDALAKEALGETDEATPEEEIEIEYEGTKAKVPAKLRDAFLRHQDYTRKTMEVAEARKALETEQNAFKQSASQIASNFEGFVQLAALNQQIQQMAATDTSGWTPVQIQAGVARLQALQNEAAQLDLSIRQTAQQRTQAEQAEYEQARQRAFTEAAARIPNFTEERWQKLKADSVAAGMDPEALEAISEPWEFETLHYADIGRKFVERQRKAASMKNAHAGTPATELGGGKGGGKSPERMTEAEFIAWRNAGGGN